MRRTRRGMTLVEVLVAISVLVVMSAVVFEALRNAAEMEEVLQGRDEVIRGARVAIARLKRDLQLAYLTPNRDAALTYQTVFVGTDESPDQVIFATLAHERMYLNTRESDQAEVTVWAERAPAERGKGYVLYHRESQRIDDKPDEDGAIHPLAYNVRSFDLKYLNGRTGEWVETWDSRGVDTPYELPRSIEINLILIGRDPEDDRRTIDVPFVTRVKVEHSKSVMGPEALLMAAAQGGGGGVPSSAGAGGNSSAGGGSSSELIR